MAGASPSDSPPRYPEVVLFHGSQKQILSFDISPDGKLIASVGEGGGIRLWNIHGTLVAPPLVGHEGPIYQATLSLDGKAIASASLDQTIRLWDGPPLAVADDGGVKGISILSDGQAIVSPGKNMDPILTMPVTAPVADT